MPYTLILPDDDPEPGVCRSEFSAALSVWTWMQQRRVSVSEAAKAFDTTVEVVRQGVADSRWMMLTGPAGDPDRQLIEHDGEV